MKLEIWNENLHFWLEWRRCIYALDTREIQLLHFSQVLQDQLNLI